MQLASERRHHSVAPIAFENRISQISKSSNLSAARRSSLRRFSRITLAFICASTFLAFSLCACPFSQSVHGEEEYEKFLGKLRALADERNDPSYLDTAIDYLDYLQATDLVSNEIKQAIDYEKGTLLIARSRKIASKKERDAVMQSGTALLKKFVSENEYHPSAPLAKNELANLLLISARIKIKDAGGAKGPLLTSAQKELVEAAQIVQATNTELAGQLKKMPANPTDDRVKKRQTKLQNDYLQGRLLLPAIQETISDTYTLEGSAWKQSLNVAAEEYLDVAKDYRLTRLEASLAATIARGRIFQRLGDTKEALASFRDVVGLENNSPTVRELKRRALKEVFPIWMNEDRAKGGSENGFVEAVKVTEEIVNSLSQQEESRQDWLKVRLDLAKAYRRYHDYLRDKPEKSKDDNIKQTQYLQKSNQAASFVARSRGPSANDARKLLVEWGVRATGDPNAETLPPPENFVDARSRAQKYLSDFEIAKKQAVEIQRQLSEPGADKAKLTTELNATNQLLLDLPSKAIETLQLAVGFTDASTPITEINAVRLRLCYSYFTLKDYTRAALIGEFLLDRFPSVSGTANCAAIAMYSYWDLYQASADAATKEFYATKVDSICSRIISIWPTSAESAEAVRMLISIAIESGKTERAITLLQRVPEESAHRKSIELNTGYAIWRDYSKRQKAALEANAPAAEMKALLESRNQAAMLLKSGASSLKANDLTATNVRALLSLAKVHSEDGNGTEVLNVLENGQVGLMNLIKADHPTTRDTKLRYDVFQLAIKGYVQTIVPDSSADSIAAVMKKASQTMEGLKVLTAKMNNGDRILVSLYFSFANDIKSKMDSMPSLAAKKNFASALNGFLLAAANSSEDLQVIMWAVGTLNNVGQSFLDGGETEASKQLFQSSSKILNEMPARKVQTSDAQKLELIRYSAKALAGTGEFEKAIEKYVEYLTAKSSSLPVQIDAANTYMMWGKKTGDSKRYFSAIMGGGPVKDPKTKRSTNKIWGWGKLSKLLTNNAKFKQQYLLARYNLSKSRVEYAGIEGATKQFATAADEIEKTREFYPDLGGRSMKAKFEALENEIKGLR